jgi:glycosyltransferase involved in cell wall biosynthesis
VKQHLRSTLIFIALSILIWLKEHVIFLNADGNSILRHFQQFLPCTNPLSLAAYLKTMKSVLFISLMNGGAWGGSEELWFQTALYAAKNGYRVGCAFYEWPQKKERIEQLKNAGCELYLFSNKGREKRTFLERLQHKITKRSVRRYSKLLPFSQYERTVINLGYLEIVSLYWKHFYQHVNNYTLLFHVHSDDDPVKPKQKALLKKWLLNARHNLFASERTKAFFENQLSIEIPYADILINPITFQPPQELTPYPVLQNGNYVFVMLATLDLRRKAQDNLIKALSAPKWKERNWTLHLYGGGESEKQLKSLIAENDVTNKIILKGHTKDVKGALANTHLLLQMTHIDAMPLAVVEAMAMAKPLAVSNVGDMPKWVAENKNGWIAENASVASIDATLEKAWQQREAWEEMGKQSFAIFKEKFPVVPEKYFLEQISQ